MPRESMWDLFRRVGFGAAPTLGFPGRRPASCTRTRRGKPVEQATMAYGHGISLSLAAARAGLHSVCARWELVPLSLVKTRRSGRREKVISTETARAVRAMLELAVQPGGTAPRARIAGWRVAGKTGTAHKQENGGYAADKVPRLVRRLRPGVRAAPGDRGDDRRAGGGPALRRLGRRAGVRPGHAGRAAPDGRARTMPPRPDRDAQRGR